MVYTFVRHTITDVLIAAAAMNSGEVHVREITVGMAAKRHPLVKAGKHSYQLSQTAERIRTYLDGNFTDLSTIPVDLSGCTSFQREVLEAARRIPYGSCVSYSELAKMAGVEQAVRAVASVMRNNRLPLIIPCHRVIKKDGSIGAYCGDASGEDALLKRRLITLERK